MIDTHKPLYDTVTTMDKVFTAQELLEGPPKSSLFFEALEQGLQSTEEILEFCENKSNEAYQIALSTGKPQTYDSIIVHCADEKEECNVDYVYCLVTPEHNFLFRREHTY